MERNDFLSAFMAAESEINLIIEDLSKQLHEKMDELLQEPDERWIERTLAFSFNDMQGNKVQSIEERHLAVAQKARILMYLHGLNAKLLLKQIGESKNRKCPGMMINQVMSLPENKKYLKMILKAFER